MNDYKSVQELIIKAALYDRVSTTISAHEMIGGIDVLRITFSKNNRRKDTLIDLHGRDKNYHEQVALFSCKDALYELLEAPYEEIEYVKENRNDKV